uniref:Uncharacterized protein n=1 Tax=viral metagenome TaxID=1070528 RepID=A0A6M3KQN2_9ZZZZ
MFEWDAARAPMSPVHAYSRKKTNEIWVFGYIIGDRIMVNEAELGHEMLHLLEGRDPDIADPDHLDKLFFK